jgi:hypothetical protein
MHKPQTTPRQQDTSRTVHSATRLQTLHACDIERELRDIPDDARLRVRQHGANVRFVTRRHGDALVRRVFSRQEIDEERRGVRQCLNQALHNLTPERRAAFSPTSKKAQERIEGLARRSIRHDIRAVEVRSPIRLLAYGTSGNRTAAEAKLSQAKPPATPRRHVTMQNLQFDQERERRLHLNAFREALRKDKTVRQALFGDGAHDHADTCLCVFSGIVSLYQQRIYDGGASDRALADLYSAHCGKGKLLQLFIDHWRAAWDAGKLSQRAFPWAGSLNGLVCEFEKLAAAETVVTTRKPSPQAERKPVKTEQRRLLAGPSTRLEKSAMSESGEIPSDGAIRLRRGVSGSEHGAPPLLARGKSKPGLMPGRQADTVPIISDSPETLRKTTPQRSHTVSRGNAPALTGNGNQERSQYRTPQRKGNVVRAVLKSQSPKSPLSPLSPASPLSPVLASLMARRRGQSAGPGYPMSRMRPTAEGTQSELPTKLQRGLSSPYRARSVKSAAALPATPGKHLY